MRAYAFAYLVTVVLAVGISTAPASIEGSPHDFRSLDAQSPADDDRKEICVFCHTPTGAEQVPHAPLWSPESPQVDYQRVSSFGITGLEPSGASRSPASLICFACHDGTQAADAGFVGSFTGLGREVRPLRGALDIDWDATREPMANSPAFHPMQTAYAGGACAGLEAACDPADAGGNASFRQVQFDIINETKSWWVDTAEGVPGVRERSDIILYPREHEGTIGPSIECAT